MSDSEDEELIYGCLGTPFNIEEDEAVENKRLKLKRKAADEEVTDEKGRALRFHGAFTGGFSAGYFNTVGSKEGFTPQHFSSSRSKASDVRNYRASKPEDFMDEEDFGEHGIAPRMLQMATEYDDVSVRDHLKVSMGSNSIFGDSNAVKDFLIPERLTIGASLLRTMGYTASKGVGEICSDEESDGDYQESDLLIRKSYKRQSTRFQFDAEEVYQLVPKVDKFGIGYSGMRKNHFGSKLSDPVNFGYRNKRGIKGTAFEGVDYDGDDDDNEDFFAKDSMRNYNYEIVDDDSKRETFGWTAPKFSQYKNVEPGSIPGFHLGKITSTLVRPHNEPLKIPRFYIPICPMSKDAHSEQSKYSKVKPKLMPDEEKSVFDLIKSNDKQRLFDLASKTTERKSRWDRDVQETKTKGYKKASTTNHLFMGFNSNYGSMFRSAGKSTETQDIDYDFKKAKGIVDDSPEFQQRIEAAKSGQYGFMTRLTENWHPDKLLCKRFNVPDPYPECTFTGLEEGIFNQSQQKKSETRNIESICDDSAVSEDDGAASTEILKTPFQEDNAEAAVQTSVIDISTNKPTIDIFKAVFEESDIEYSDDEDDVENSKTVTSFPSVNDKNLNFAPPKSIVSSLEEALGAMIGGNPDDIHNKNRLGSMKFKPQLNSTVIKPKNIYGPQLPPGFIYNQANSVDAADAVDKSFTKNDIISRNIPDRKLDLGVTDSNEEYEFKDPEQLKKMKRKEKKKKKKSKSKHKEKRKKHASVSSSDELPCR